MIGILYILLFWLIGNGISLLIGGWLSGNIIGMILLFIALTLRWIDAEKVRLPAKFLLGIMALFFVPYGVRLMVSWRVIVENMWAIVAAGLISTIIVLVVTGHTYQIIEKLKAKRR